MTYGLVLVIALSMVLIALGSIIAIAAYQAGFFNGRAYERRRRDRRDE